MTRIVAWWKSRQQAQAQALLKAKLIGVHIYGATLTQSALR